MSSLVVQMLTKYLSVLMVMFEYRTCVDKDVWLCKVQQSHVCYIQLTMTQDVL